MGGAPGPRCGGWPAGSKRTLRAPGSHWLAGFGWARLSASAGFSLGFPAGFRLDFGFGLGLIWLDFGFWLSFIWILFGFDLLWLDFGWIWLDFG